MKYSMSLNFSLLFLLLCCVVIDSYCGPVNKLSIKRVVLWGHKLHSHTHSYIHWGFYRAFKHLGYDVYWFDNLDSVNHFDFAESLFITEWQVDQNMPLRDDSFYIVHNMCEDNRILKYQKLVQMGRAIDLRAYWDRFCPKDAIKVDDYTYYHLEKHEFHMPWATDLLPHEIEDVKMHVGTMKRKFKINWIGTVGAGEYGNTEYIDPFKRACRENGISFNVMHAKNMDENIALIQESFMAPAIQGRVQLDNGYIPCRIFKNISYGQFGITNSALVNELFKGKLIYNNNTYQLFFDAKKRLADIGVNDLYELMDFVKERHTYLNRIRHILDFLLLNYNYYGNKIF